VRAAPAAAWKTGAVAKPNGGGESEGARKGYPGDRLDGHDVV
jgi:hypothetical protein